MAKGGSYEREVCTLFSEWWTDYKDDDIFWRSSNSGGRATVRGRTGKRTRGHEGDICSTHKSGLPLTRLITFEVKRGYTRKGKKRLTGGTIADLLDRPKVGLGQQLIDEWICQTTAAAERAGTPFWALIQRRDKRLAMIFFPHDLYRELCLVGCFDRLPIPCVSLTVRVRGSGKDEWFRHSIWGVRLDKFLRKVRREHILQVYKKFKGRRE